MRSIRAFASTLALAVCGTVSCVLARSSSVVAEPAAAGATASARRAPPGAVAAAEPQVGILSEDVDPVPPAFSMRRRSLSWTRGDGEVDDALLVGPWSNAEAAPVERFIRTARRSLDVEIYMMTDPTVRAAILDALTRGVRVRVVQEPSPLGFNCDAWGEGSRSRRCQDAQTFVQNVRRAGGRYEKFNSAELCARGRCFQHGKVIVVDGRFALVSTGNFNSSNLCTREARPPVCNRDYTYVTRDPAVVQAISDVIERDLEGRAHDPREPLRRREAESKLTVSPYSAEPLRRFIESAREKIQIQNQYLRPDSGLSSLLIKKAREGVRVELQLADVCYYKKPPETPRLVQERLGFAEMESAGVQIRLFPRAVRVGGRDGYLHAKAIVVDGRRAWIGSVNGSSQSLNQNREFGVFFANPARVRALAEVMSADFADPANQTWRDSFDCRGSRRHERGEGPANRRRSRSGGGADSGEDATDDASAEDEAS